MTASDRSARLVGGAFVAAGVAHFTRPDFFEAIVPRWFPDARLANRGSGAAEIALGLGMFPRRTRRLSARGLLLLLGGVFPANVDMYLHDVDLDRDADGRITRVEDAPGVRGRNLARLPVQLLLAWAVARHSRGAAPVGESLPA